jgi:hypothetical protein
MDQLEFDLGKGRRRRDEGMASAARPQVQRLELARSAAADIARERGSVTTDEVRMQLGLTPGRSNEQNWMGSIFRDERFEWSGEVVLSKIPASHARMIKVWRLK